MGEIFHGHPTKHLLQVI